jgi:hypothetical protein
LFDLDGLAPFSQMSKSAAGEQPGPPDSTDHKKSKVCGAIAADLFLFGSQVESGREFLLDRQRPFHYMVGMFFLHASAVKQTLS